MKFRGPDNTTRIMIDSHHFGHQRLKILGLGDDSNQPLYSKSKKHLIIYNGEIYNFNNLAYKYSINLKTGCDTELGIELFEKVGAEFIHELNGMFSILIFNIEDKSIFAARDRLGIKPLYYSMNRGLYFCSEIAPIKYLIDNITIDEIGLRQYLLLRSFFNNHTIYNEIKSFPPAHYYKNGKFYRYWSIPDKEQSPPTDNELFDLLCSSIEYRKVSDVPIGSYLSGGLDSTLITALAKTKNTWTVGLENENEFKWSSLASCSLKTTHKEVVMSPQLYLSNLKTMVQVRQEPLSVPNEVFIYEMTKKVKEKNMVILSGEGADELFFGYDRIFKWASQASSWDLKKFSELYSYSTTEDLEIIEYAIDPFVNLKKPILIVAAFFQIAHLHGLLRRLDFATMLCGVEARVPFVDHRIVERLAGTPIEYRMEKGIVKAPLKRLAQGIIPSQIIQRRKVGFPVNLNYIFNNNESFRYNMKKFFKLNLSILGVR